MLDYATLKIIWWVLIGALLIGFAIMDGHDMGVGTLLPFVGRNDTERRIVINTVAAHWDGNQVWFITAGGAIFAAWPIVYATAFSGLYWAMLVVLFALFFRPVGFDYRSKLADPRWRSAWDWGLFVGGAVPPLIFGVAFGNLLQGLPFHFDANMVPYYTGSFWGLLNPFALLCGVVSTAMITAHGGIYLAHRTEGAVQARARAAALLMGAIALVAFSAAGVWVATGIEGYVVTAGLDPAGPASPLAKTVVRSTGAWFANYGKAPVVWLAPALAYAGMALALLAVARRRTLTAFVLSSLGMAGVILTAGASMFPFVMPSSTVSNASLTAFDAVSSHFTLALMLGATLIFLPIVLLYTGWAYRVMRGKVTAAYVQEHPHSAY
jgi:cytochrome bd ubiquinol oxidase subunit II